MYTRDIRIAELVTEIYKLGTTSYSESALKTVIGKSKNGAGKQQLIKENDGACYLLEHESASAVELRKITEGGIDNMSALSAYFRGHVSMIKKGRNKWYKVANRKNLEEHIALVNELIGLI